MIIQEGINTLVQLAVVLVVCGLVWLVFGRKGVGFRQYLGLYAPPLGGWIAALIIFMVWGAITTTLYMIPELTEAVTADNTVAGGLRAFGFSGQTMVLILIIAVFKTALTEEIFFRGLIAKRLIHHAGFRVGNTLQALLFGSVHLLIFVIPGGPEFTPMLGLAFLCLPGAAGWLMGFANERYGAGSIAPGWLIHALGNATSYPIMAFLL
ncbi:MAG: CPBP family intramembrane glutamic endopeptidase [Pseudomonadota bacterium]